ncbi:hypothetical protein PGT21_022896 [Puccinia graminis f. sp. tritici]|uniref:Uncharacterized protein n=1 Tax=Puccinia graminis f. sp. tritici TaxID=56615 RepID=A0A5B0LPL1_PUCGR|nr:hypothetical protein PGT21_022896 [Puccinia graminis f. sp. tritici]
MQSRIECSKCGQNFETKIDPEAANDKPPTTHQSSTATPRPSSVHSSSSARQQQQQQQQRSHQQPEDRFDDGINDPDDILFLLLIECT